MDHKYGGNETPSKYELSILELERLRQQFAERVGSRYSTLEERTNALRITREKRFRHGN